MIIRTFMSMMVALMLATGVVGAQDVSNSSSQQQQLTDRAKQRMQELKERLQLTPEQSEQLRPIMLEEFQKLKAVRDKYNSDGDGTQRPRTKMKMGREMKSIQSETDQKLQSILSKQQMDDLHKLRDEWREQMRERATQR